MKQYKLKKIALIVFVLFFVGLLTVSLHLAHRVKALEAQKRLWTRERHKITQELRFLNSNLKKFHEMIKEQGNKPFYEKLLEETEGEKANDISEQQIKFDFMSLNFLKEDTFFDVIKNVIRGLKMRLSCHYKDAFALFGKTKNQTNHASLANIPSIWPTEGTITSKFGMRRHPILKKPGFHSGIDIANFKSTDILCSADGVVTFSGKNGGYGNMVVVNHGNGFETLYGHADYLLVYEGDQVFRGTVVARMGSTGMSTGSHLHYEIRFAGEPINPTMFVN
jgi:murein DD-endopeptidase MepM/ murein hydrolase activator NlpD